MPIIVACIGLILAGCDAAEKAVAEHVEPEINIIQAEPEDMPIFLEIMDDGYIPVISPWGNIAADAHSWSPEQKANVLMLLDRAPYQLEGQLGFTPTLTGDVLTVGDQEFALFDELPVIQQPTIMSLQQGFSSIPEGTSLVTTLQRQDAEGLWHVYDVSRYVQKVGPAEVARLHYDEVINRCDWTIRGVPLRFSVAAWDDNFLSRGMHHIHTSSEFVVLNDMVMYDCEEYNPISAISVADQIVYFSALAPHDGQLCAKITYGNIQDGIDPYVGTEDLGAVSEGETSVGGFLLMQEHVLEKVDLTIFDGDCTNGQFESNVVTLDMRYPGTQI